ncbi:MAG: EAL domain-containing protein [Phenylobacterium sp.]|uniref:putative bifunctional diguanylate cyclase/phosphodiesterase n=1 Tax=Phenylobacterium sp. TaxID=1871053 RepID=UPI0027346E83|nr:EAL domain-containing protein [Phenylobacterium sp.]MDP3747332.1 EAL domain-containing protein [Phenylobacterium sp.]
MAWVEPIARRLAGFRRLRTKLTVLYAGLFGVALLLVSGAIYSAISGAAQRQVRDELTASGAVFDRIWSLRTEQLRQGVALLSRDFGFREAVATGDGATIVSAMENLRQRLQLDLAFIVGVDGTITAADPKGLNRSADALVEAMYEQESPSGIFVLDGMPYQMIAAPILSPDLIGWVVFAARLDQREMEALEKLSAIPLDASVMHRAGKAWKSELAVSDPAGLGGFIDGALTAKSKAPRTLATKDGASLVLVKPLRTLTGKAALADKQGAVLVLSYPLARALAPYKPLLATIGGVGLLGLVLVVAGSWGLARSVTRPISALATAANRLREGQDSTVAVESQDEIGHLAESFNVMATEIRERERRITHLALHDPETHLPNRLSLEQAIETLAVAGGGSLYVALLGVDRFAHVRGAIGYALAAQAIREVGERLAGLQRQAFVARISTDVLGMAFEAADDEAAQAMMARLLRELEQPLQIGGDAIDVALSVGLSAFASGEPGGAAIERANIGLDQARSARKKLAFFDAEAYGDPSSNLALMSGMLWALRSGHIELYHQPKYDLRARGVNGVEGLVRWRHPTRGMLRPDLFIPMAEETGHIRTLTDWVLKQAIADQTRMGRAGHPIEVSVNISGRLLGDTDFADFVDRTVGEASGKLCFEITETAVIENPDMALEILDRFRAAGISISIDDFGSGLSSLAYLKQIKGHELKIDRSLITDLTESQRDALIVRSTIDLAHSLGLKVTAEGVETANAFQLLAAMGCDNVQGYLIAKPMPFNELLMFLNEDRDTERSYG